MTTKILLTAELTDEQIYTISNAKWYNPIVEWGENPTSRAEFILQVYDGIIKSDIKSIYLQEINKSLSDEMERQSNTIDFTIANAITTEIQ